MKRVIKVLALVCLMTMVFSMMATALAESKSYKGIGTVTYTVTTGKKDATLKISVAKGKLQAINRKGKKIKKNCGASYHVSVNGSVPKSVSTDPFGSATYNLEKNGTYYVTVEYVTWLPFTGMDMTLNDGQWVKNPTVKLSVNHGAKIR